jgi:hypothetical protein
MLAIEGNTVNLLSAIMFIVAGPAIGFIIWQFYISAIEFVWSKFQSQGDKKYEFLREYSRLRSCCQDKERAELDEVNAQYQFGISTGIAVIIIAFLYLIFYLFDVTSSDYIKFNIYHFDFSNNTISINNAPECSSPASIQLQRVINSKISVPEQTKEQLQELSRLQCDLQNPSHIILLLVLFGVPAILLLGAFFYNRGVRLQLICELMEKYPSIQSTQVCRERKISRPEAIVILSGDNILSGNYNVKPDEKILVRPGQIFTLDGSHSYDPEDKEIEYSWNQIHGPSMVYLDGEESAVSKKTSKKIKIKIPCSTIIGQTFSFQLIVSNRKTSSRPFLINFEVR